MLGFCMVTEKIRNDIAIVIVRMRKKNKGGQSPTFIGSELFSRQTKRKEIKRIIYIAAAAVAHSESSFNSFISRAPFPSYVSWTDEVQLDFAGNRKPQQTQIQFKLAIRDSLQSPRHFLNRAPVVCTVAFHCAAILSSQVPFAEYPLLWIWIFIPPSHRRLRRRRHRHICDSLLCGVMKCNKYPFITSIFVWIGYFIALAMVSFTTLSVRFVCLCVFRGGV